MSQNFPPAPYGNPPFSTAQNTGKKRSISAGAIVAIVVGVVLLLTMLCAGAAFFFIRNMAVDSTDLVTKRTNDGIASLEVPKNWKPILGSDANPEASLQLGNLFAETYAMVLSEAKSDFAEIGGDNPNEDGSYSLEDYTDLIISMMSAPGAGITASPKESMTHQAMPAYRFTLKGSVDGNGVAFTGMIVEGERHFHQVLCWTLAQQEAKNMPVLKSVLSSFRETAGNRATAASDPR